MPKLKVLIALSFLLLPSAFLFAQTEPGETLTIATYYPSPYGYYKNFDTFGETHLATEGGNVGIGTTTPYAKLDVVGGIRPGNNTIVTSCSVFTEGTQRYNSTSKQMEFCNGASWVKLGGGASYAVIVDQKPAGTNEPSTTTWGARDLNTEISDPDDIVSITSNQFTLQPGNYLIEASAPMMYVSQHRIRLQNITNGTTVAMGTSSYSNDGSMSESRSWVSAVVSISAAKIFEIQHRCANSYYLGFGYANGYAEEIYTVVKITKFQ